MDQTKLFETLKDNSHMLTMRYESEPELLKGKVAEAPLIAGKKITKLTRVQVNPVKQYRKLKAAKLGIEPSKVEIMDRPDWVHVSEGIVRKGDVLMFQASPVRELESQFLVDGQPANSEQQEQIESCLKSRNRVKAVELRTYRLDRIREVNASKQSLR